MSGNRPKLRRDDIRMGALDTGGTMKRAAYERRLAKLQQRMLEIHHAYLHTGDRAVIVFEGVDAAGKGGTIRRLTRGLDPRAYKVWPIGAPNEIERRQHYLSRFWSRLPEPGMIAVFDRSWYGRVLVERVEGLAAKTDWRRAYREINDFEHMLVDDGVRVVKLFLHISPAEPLKRFEERLRHPLKRWKFTVDDIRNRTRWDDYEKAIDDMIAETSTDAAPWRVIPTDSKRLARIEAMTQVTETLAAGVDLRPRPLDAELVEKAQDLLGLDLSEKG
jgi:polyphosphate kinase 2 (PPK2 family)